MNPKLIITGRSFYALALVLFGIQQCVLGKLVAGRPLAWPDQLRGETVVVLVSGTLLILAGLFVLANSKYQQGLIVVGILLLGGAALPNLVEVVLKGDNGALLTNTGKALTLGSGAFLVLRTFSDLVTRRPHSLFVRLSLLCRYCFGSFLLASGIQHFLFADFVQLLVPAWMPGALFWAYASGVFLVVSGVLLLIGWKPSIVGKVISLVIFGWFLVLHLPRAMGITGNANEWTAAFEALAFSGLAYLVSYQRADDK